MGQFVEEILSSAQDLPVGGNDSAMGAIGHDGFGAALDLQEFENQIGVVGEKVDRSEKDMQAALEIQYDEFSPRVSLQGS